MCLLSRPAIPEDSDPRGEFKEGADLPATPLSSRSGESRRVVNSTLAGETQAARSATAEVEWTQVLLRDAMFGDVQVSHLSPFISVFSKSCVAAQQFPHQHVVDAKSLYDTVINGCRRKQSRPPIGGETLHLRGIHRKSGSIVR